MFNRQWGAVYVPLHFRNLLILYLPTDLIIPAVLYSKKMMNQEVSKFSYGIFIDIV